MDKANLFMPSYARFYFSERITLHPQVNHLDEHLRDMCTNERGVFALDYRNINQNLERIHSNIRIGPPIIQGSKVLDNQIRGVGIYLREEDFPADLLKRAVYKISLEDAINGLLGEDIPTKFFDKKLKS